jgi:hypothetical protein
MSHKFKAGDALWFVSIRGNRPATVTVKAVGRKWVTLDGFIDGQRIAIDDKTMSVEIPEYGSVGRCYPSEQHYLDDRALANAWEKFRRDVQSAWRAPDAATVELIAEARKTFGLSGGAA